MRKIASISAFLLAVALMALIMSVTWAPGADVRALLIVALLAAVGTLNQDRKLRAGSVLLLAVALCAAQLGHRRGEEYRRWLAKESVLPSPAVGSVIESIGLPDLRHTPTSAWLTPTTSVVMQTTPCFGDCPEYKLTIRGDGQVTFEGKTSVVSSGTHHAQITQDQVRALADAFIEADFFGLRDTYVGQFDGCKAIWTDLPSTVVTVMGTEHPKSVNHYHGCEGAPSKLSILENKIPEIVGANHWIKAK